MMYTKETNSVLITAIPKYHEGRSSMFENVYVWEYNIRIENKGHATIQLLNRHWKIVDSTGQIKEVTGPGVIGIQPILAPGEDFEYASETSLPTPSGMMFGVYEMSTTEGDHFNVEIPAFSLDCPHIKSSMN